jgi:LacI family transcriptional regulator
MKNKRHSIKDIASKLNVSVTTVSFVLNGKAKEMRISELVAKKIIEYTEKINYKPNRVAQSLRTGKSKIIVFMVEDISNFFFAKIARIIEDIAYEKGYKVLFCSNENDDEKSLELIDLFKVLQVDGYIIIPSGGIEDKIASLISESIPVVLFDRYFPGLDTNYVIIDNENASFNATAHLAENKFQNIGFITTDVKQTQMLDRLQGYKMAIKEHNLNEKILQISYKEKDSAIGKRDILEFFRTNPKLDSVFFATNYLTQIGLEVIKENFPSLVNEIGIITFDDNDFFKIFNPPISAIAQPLFKIGNELMDIMLNLLNDSNKTLPTKRVVLNAKLQVRNSSFEKIR